MTKKEIAVNAVHALKKEYPDAICSLVYTDPLQLLIATRLAAQCTDARVNMVTPSLFDRFKTAQDFADSTPEEVAEYIKSCGLYKTKSKDIVENVTAHKICGFSADSGEFCQIVNIIGNDTAKIVTKHYCTFFVLRNKFLTFMRLLYQFFILIAIAEFLCYTEENSI